MTVNATARRSGPYTANGTNRLFDFAFKITDADQLKIVVQDDLAGTNAVEYTSGYTIPDPTDIGSDNGGTLSFPTLPTGPLAAGKIVFILSNAAYSQPAAIGNEGAFYPETHEEAFDRLEIQIQQLVELASRAVTAPTGQTGAQYIAALLLQGAGYATAAAASATAANGSAVAAAASAAGALSAFNNFRDVYLGAFAVAPTTDIDGSALELGDLYYDTVGQAMKIWIGASWVAAYVSGSGYAATANNLSDLASATTALTNLGLTANAKSLVTAVNYAAMKTLLSLDQVNNTSDVNKPVSTAQAAANALALPLAGGTLSGVLVANVGISLATGATTPAQGQIAFPAAQNASSDANTLDDYEEGTFTPSYIATGSTFAYTTQQGWYTKMGNRVTIDINIVLAGAGNTLTANQIAINGLPFTVTLTNRPALCSWTNLATAIINMQCLITSASTTISSISALTAAAISTGAMNANILSATAGSQVRVNGQYTA